jgi:hypothetical protein
MSQKQLTVFTKSILFRSIAMKIKNLALVNLLFFSVTCAVTALADGTTNKDVSIPEQSADGHTTDQNKAAKEFAFEGVSLGVTYSEIKAKYPDIEFRQNDSDAKVGLAVWTTYNPKTADSVDFYFLSGKLYKVRVLYMSKTLNKIGGYETIYEKLVAKYGKEDEASFDNEKLVCDYTWQFFTVDRYINYSVIKDSNSGFLVVADKTASRQLTEKQKSKANVGF